MTPFTALPRLAGLLVLTMSSAFAQTHPALKTLDSIVDPKAHTFAGGQWGIAINGQTYQQEGVTTFNGYQYSAYFGEGGLLAIGRRKLPDTTWETIRFHDYRIPNHKDIHNVAVVGICPGDGSVHLSYDHHANDLRYRKSVPGLASDPASFAWKAEHFGPTTSALVPGEKVSGVTYPQFFYTPESTLQFVFRTGSSGNGRWHLWEYSGRTGAWTRVGKLFDSVGHYQGSDTRCAYPDQFRYGPDKVLHATWVWREAPDLMANHDLFHASSSDFGRTWKNCAGEVIADLAADKAITVESPGILVHEFPLQRGTMNTTTLAIDAQGQPHTVRWQVPADAAEGSKDLNDWRYVHYWRTAGGEWKSHQLPMHGRKPQLVLAKDGNAFLVYTKGDNADYHNRVAQGHLKVATATAASGYTDWQDVYTSELQFISEPLLDYPRWQAEGILSVYVQENPVQPGQGSPLHVIDFIP